MTVATLSTKPGFSANIRHLRDGPESLYRVKQWPRLPRDQVGTGWADVNTFRRAKFRHVVVVEQARTGAALDWTRENFGPHALGNMGTTDPRYWTRGVWTYLYSQDETLDLMFIERGMATMAKVFWG